VETKHILQHSKQFETAESERYVGSSVAGYEVVAQTITITIATVVEEGDSAADSAQQDGQTESSFERLVKRLLSFIVESVLILTLTLAFVRQSIGNGRTKGQADVRRDVRGGSGRRSLDSAVDSCDRQQSTVTLPFTDDPDFTGSDECVGASQCGQSKTTAALSFDDCGGGCSPVAGRVCRGGVEGLSETFERSNLAFDGQQQHSTWSAASLQSGRSRRLVRHQLSSVATATHIATAHDTRRSRYNFADLPLIRLLHKSID
jgi:hypothetical protein